MKWEMIDSWLEGEKISKQEKNVLFNRFCLAIFDISYGDFDNLATIWKNMWMTRCYQDKIIMNLNYLVIYLHTAILCY